MGQTRKPRLLAAALGAATLLLGACTAPLPDVGFYANRDATSTGPSLWCAVDDTATDVQCSVDIGDRNAVTLPIRAGQGVQVSVPGEVGDQPWTIVFRYTDAAGEHDARTAIFGPGERLAYVLAAPAPDARITRVEVQSGLTLVQGASGGVDVAVLRSWVLLTSPADPAVGQ
jgi:hypothetical protein